MCRIINVDFVNKKLEFTWNQEAIERKELIEKIDKRFRKTLAEIDQIEGHDHNFMKSCAVVLANIVYNLRRR